MSAGEGLENTYSSQPLVASPELGLDARVRAAAAEDSLAVLDPPLRGALSEVDLLALMPAGEGVEVDAIPGGSC